MFEHRLKTLPFRSWLSEINGGLRWSIRFCGSKTSCYQRCSVKVFGCSGHRFSVCFRSIAPRVSTRWGPDLRIADTPLSVFRNVGPVCFWLAEAPLWAPFLGCWIPFFDTLGPRCGCSFVRVWCVADYRKPFENITLRAWFWDIRRIFRWSMRFCGSKICFRLFKGCRSSLFGFPVHRFFFFSEILHPEFRQVGVPIRELLLHPFCFWECWACVFLICRGTALGFR